jgi:glycosyltransferase involved in cell wall biosynthesis
MGGGKSSGAMSEMGVMRICRRPAMRSKTARVGYPEDSIVLKVPKIKSLDTSSPRPFWSVMIPVYNPPLQYLEETLRCVLDQDVGAGEMQIEVIDDASPNGAPIEFVRKIAGERIKVHCEPRNLGLAGIWNRCIERARGEWVHILHQDDLVFPGFYQSLRSGVESFPEAGAALCRHAYCDENGHWHRLSILEMPSPGLLQNFVEPLVTAERVACPAIAVRRSTYEQLGGFNPDLKHALDWEMWIRIASKSVFFYEPKILACWRNHAGAITSRQIRSGENIRDIAKAIRIWSSYLPENDAKRLSVRARQQFAQSALGMAAELLRQNDFEGSLNQASAALVCNNTFRLQLSAAKIRMKAHAKRILKWRDRGWHPLLLEGKL